MRVPIGWLAEYVEIPAGTTVEVLDGRPRGNVDVLGQPADGDPHYCSTPSAATEVTVVVGRQPVTARLQKLW